MLGLEFGGRGDRADRLEESHRPWAVDPAAHHLRGGALPPAGCRRRAQAGAAAAPAHLDRRLRPPAHAAARRGVRGRLERGRGHPGGGRGVLADPRPALRQRGATPARSAARGKIGAGADDVDGLRAVVEPYVAVGVTDIVLIVRGEDPVTVAEQVTERLPGLRELG